VIPSMEATKALNYHRQDSLVVSTSSALREWNTVSTRRDLDVDLTDCMDRAPAIGLGLALARPNDKVMVLDCDATLRTDLGSMVTIGESNPENLVHFVFDDSSHISTGGIAIQGVENVNLAAMALGAGYAKTYEFGELEELLIGMEEIMKQPGPVFVLVKVFRDQEILPFPERTMADGWAEVRNTLLAAG
jgi:thiamine pyrophosphate-dependent acetolactate synthase large subunit-like protein